MKRVLVPLGFVLVFEPVAAKRALILLFSLVSPVTNVSKLAVGHRRLKRTLALLLCQTS
jgi:hypothetical protein